MPFIPTHPDPGEAYGADLREAFDLLYRRAEAAEDIVTQRMLSHYRMHVDHERGTMHERMRELDRRILALSHPRGIIFNEGKLVRSMRWMGGEISYRLTDDADFVA